MAYGNIAGWGRGPYGIGAYGRPITSGGWGDAGPPEIDIKKIKKMKRQQFRLKDDEEVAAMLILQMLRGKS